MKPPQLIDPFNRNLTYLRVSITDRCNLRCMYCMPSRETIPRLAHTQVLRYEEILRIVRIGVQLGITKIRITGGEPLVRKGVYEFLSELGKIEGLTDISLTTNGVLLKDHLAQIRDAGIKRLNISLDTLDREKFIRITGHDAFTQVWEGIEAAHRMGFAPIKFNTVAMKGINDDELTDIARLSFTYPFHMRFIEYMPIGDHHLDRSIRLLAPEILARISPLGDLTPIRRNRDDGPAERYRFQGCPGGNRHHPAAQQPFLSPLQPASADGQRPAAALPPVRPPGGSQGPHSKGMPRRRHRQGVPGSRAVQTHGASGG